MPARRPALCFREFARRSDTMMTMGYDARTATPPDGTREAIAGLLGPRPDRAPMCGSVMEVADCGTYARERVTYPTSTGPVTAYVCIPHERPRPMPAVFCHHQHASRFALGKSEVVGLDGDPDQAYAHELAERGYITFAPDALGFEARVPVDDPSANVTWFELARRLVAGRTLLATCLDDVSAGIDYLISREEVADDRIGFLGHSYGGRMALWAPAFEPRIAASVSHAGCVSYRESDSYEVGFQAEFVVPGFADRFDVENLLDLYGNTALLISGGTRDPYSRGIARLIEEASTRLGTRAESAVYDAGHEFARHMRARAYDFLDHHLQDR